MRIENKLIDNWLNLNLSLAGLSWPIYIGGQVLRIRLGLIQITIPFTIWSCILNVTVPGPSFHRLLPEWAPRGTKIAGLGSNTLVSCPRDSTRIVDLGWISNLHNVDVINLRLDQSSSSFLSRFHWIFHIIKFSWGFLVNKPGASDGSGNKLIAWAKTCYLLQTQVPGLEFST
jgi:hypothetical protein